MKLPWRRDGFSAFPLLCCATAILFRLTEAVRVSAQSCNSATLSSSSGHPQNPARAEPPTADARYVPASPAYPSDHLELLISAFFPAEVDLINSEGTYYSGLVVNSYFLTSRVFSANDVFCRHVVGPPDSPEASCPISAGSFAKFTVAVNVSERNMQFGTLKTEIRVASGEPDEESVACVTVYTTFRQLPAVWVSIVVTVASTVALLAFADVFGLLFSIWSVTKNFFYLSEAQIDNPELSRLLFPGSCEFLLFLQYFFFLGGLNLRYPQFYRHVLSNFGFSVLFFRIPGAQDGIYAAVSGAKGLFGLFSASTTVNVLKIWPIFMASLLAITAIFLIVAQCISMTVWLRLRLQHRFDDLTGPYDRFWHQHGFLVLGLTVRLVYSVFSLPLSVFTWWQVAQLTGESGVARVWQVLAPLVLVAWFGGAVGFCGLWLYRKTGRAQLRAEHSLGLVFGSLFAPYREAAVAFAAVPLIHSFLFGLVLGAVYKSGVAQVALLAILEVALLIAIAVWRPFHAHCGMNRRAAALPLLRLILVLLSVAFLPELDATLTAQSIVAYVILGIEGLIVVVFFIHGTRVVSAVASDRLKQHWKLSGSPETYPRRIRWLWRSLLGSEPAEPIRRRNSVELPDWAGGGKIADRYNHVILGPSGSGSSEELRGEETGRPEEYFRQPRFVYENVAESSAFGSVAELGRPEESEADIAALLAARAHKVDYTLRESDRFKEEYRSKVAQQQQESLDLPEPEFPVAEADEMGKTIRVADVGEDGGKTGKDVRKSKLWGRSSFRFSRFGRRTPQPMQPASSGFEVVGRGRIKVKQPKTVTVAEVAEVAESEDSALNSTNSLCDSFDSDSASASASASARYLT